MLRPRDFNGGKPVTVTLLPSEIVALAEAEWTDIEDSDDDEWAALASGQGKLREALKQAVH